MFKRTENLSVHRRGYILKFYWHFSFLWKDDRKLNETLPWINVDFSTASKQLHEIITSVQSFLDALMQKLHLHLYISLSDQYDVWTRSSSCIEQPSQFFSGGDDVWRSEQRSDRNTQRRRKTYHWTKRRNNEAAPSFGLWKENKVVGSFVAEKLSSVSFVEKHTRGSKNIS